MLQQGIGTTWTFGDAECQVAVQPAILSKLKIADQNDSEASYEARVTRSTALLESLRSLSVYVTAAASAYNLFKEAKSSPRYPARTTSARRRIAFSLMTYRAVRCGTRSACGSGFAKGKRPAARCAAPPWTWATRRLQVPPLPWRFEQLFRYLPHQAFGISIPMTF